MTKKGKQVLEFILSFIVSASTTPLIVHWLGAGMSSEFTFLLDSIVIPTFATLTYFSRDEVKKYIKTKNPDLAKTLSTFLDFEEKDNKNQQKKKTKKQTKENNEERAQEKQTPPPTNNDISINDIMPIVPSNYFDIILKKTTDTSIYYDDETITYLNHLLNYIGHNYYKDKKNQSKYIKLLIDQIFIYSEQTNLTTFSDRDIKNIIDNCYFMGSDLKDKIKSEYKSCFKEPVKLYYDDYKKINNIIVPEQYTIYDMEYYISIINQLIQEDILIDFADPEMPLEVAYDIPFLMQAVQTIFSECKYKFADSSEFFCPTTFVSSLICNAGIEAIKDNSYTITLNSIMKSIKNNAFLDEDEKEKIFKKITLNMYGIAPREDKIPQEKVMKKSAKIIQFPKQANNN